LNKKLFHFPTN